MPSNLRFLIIVLIVTVSPLMLPGHGYADDSSGPKDYYEIQPGDVLQVSVWKEDDLTQAVIVRPDGQISFPLAGEAEAAGSRVS